MAEVEYTVINTLDEKGTPVHGNESARKNALAKTLGEDTAYQLAVKALGQAQSERASAGLDVQRLEDKQRALRAVADLTCAETQLLVAAR